MGRDKATSVYEVVKAPPWASSDFYLRRKRDRVKEATKGELRCRIALGKIALKSYGERGFGPDGLPIVTSNIKREMEGKEYSEEEKIVLSDEILREIRRAMMKRGVSMLELPSRFQIEVPLLTSE